MIHRHREIVWSDDETNLRRQTFLIVNDHSPAEVHFVMPNLDQSSWLKERQTVRRMGDNIPKVAFQFVKLIAKFIVIRYDLLLGHNDLRLSLLFFDELWQRQVKAL